MFLIPTTKRGVSDRAIVIALVLLLTGVVPTGSLFESGPAGAATVDTGLIVVGLDVWLHMFGYGVLAAALVLSADRNSWPVLISAVVAATALGVAVEALQVPLAFRTGSLLDGLANATGAILGAGTASLVRVVSRE